ncbi:MAG: hypothetical protein DDT26_00229 [Dehalococcoidia bacterium]|nr:hypothetical protein [Chloroflexota bacterium]
MPAHFVDTVSVLDTFHISREMLYNCLPHLTIGKHYIDVAPPNAKRRSLRWNIEALREFWAVPPEKRG